ncbi:glutarate dioxygenase GlaH [Paraburkholderia sp. MM5482-R1]|uniref:glutarate dioxygenase GlaH n=1 Tax=unclassified Paraburkholderia TaxID=2615204 RepID=UPI003D22770B
MQAVEATQVSSFPSTKQIASPLYTVGQNPNHARIRHIEIDTRVLERFFEEVKDVNSQNLEYVPYMRFILAGKLEQMLGTGFRETVRGILRDRNSGGLTVGVQGVTDCAEDYVKFGTAIAHLVGPANHDAMSGTYYARFLVKDTDNSDSYLRQAYRLFTLHTDGTFVDEPTDWLLMMKFSERNAIGGESRLLHLDDWAQLEEFSTHPLASYKFTYKSPPSKNLAQEVERRTFFKVDGKPAICFIDQFAQPESIEHARYLHRLSDSMEASKGTAAIPLPTGDLVMLNNLFWLHGRAPFEKNPDLHRELMRIRGEFATL